MQGMRSIVGALGESGSPSIEDVELSRKRQL